MDIPPEHYFHLQDGTVVMSLEELEKKLKTMKGPVYKHHVTHDRNDFENWILNVFNDPVLAKKLHSAKSAKTAGKFIAARRKELKPKVQQKVLKRRPSAHKSKLAKVERQVKRVPVPRATLRKPSADQFVEGLIMREAVATKRTDASPFLRSAAVDFGLGLLVGILIGIVIAKAY